MAKVDVVMPKMGESITEGTVIVWHKQPGDTVEVDETILEIGTDKVDTEVPAPEDGVLAEILVDEGATVAVGTRLAVLSSDGSAPAPSGDSESTPPAPARRGGKAAQRLPGRAPRSLSEVQR